MPNSKPTLVCVWPRRSIKGYDGKNADEVTKHPVVSIMDGLTATYDTDAHFVPYTVVDKDGTTSPTQPRLNKAAREKIEESGRRIVFSTAVIDVDDDVAHKAETAARSSWREEQDDAYGDLPSELQQGMARYDTRGGYRLLWQLPTPLGIEAYLAHMTALRRELYTHHIVADELIDWGRCYRLPSVVRDGKKQKFDADLSPLSQVSSWVGSGGGASSDPFDVFDNIGKDKKERLKLDPTIAITENRNTTLTRLAGSWRRTGLPEQTILAMLRVVNKEQVSPPLQDPELCVIASSVARYDPPSTDGETVGVTGAANLAGPRFMIGDEEEIARAIAQDLEDGGEELIYDRSQLWQYSKERGIWEHLQLDVVSRIVQDYSGEQIFRGLDRNGNPKLAQLKVSARFVAGCNTLLGSRKTKYKWFDNAPDGIVFGKEFVSVTNKGDIERVPTKASLRQTVAQPWAFDGDAMSEPTGFVALLRDIWRDDEDQEDKVQTLREWVGAALLGHAPRYQRALILSGEGANGKSTVQSVISALFPVGTVTAIPPQDMEQEYRRAKLAGARLNCVSELPEADILISEPVKAMISGDLVMGRHIRQDPFEFKPLVAHLFAANALPGVRDMSTGFWRRWIVLEFNRRFMPHEQDRNIAQRIIATDLPAIASWCIHGAAELAHRGHHIDPPSSIVSLEAWRKSADQIAGFVDQRLDFGTEEQGVYGVLAQRLYTEYTNWAVDNGHKRMSRTNFGKRLTKLGVEKKRTREGILYLADLKAA